MYLCEGTGLFCQAGPGMRPGSADHNSISFEAGLMACVLPAGGSGAVHICCGSFLFCSECKQCFGRAIHGRSSAGIGFVSCSPPHASLASNDVLLQTLLTG